MSLLGLLDDANKLVKECRIKVDISLKKTEIWNTLMNELYDSDDDMDSTDRKWISMAYRLLCFTET